MVNYKLSIGCVDGETELEFDSTDKKEVLEYLKQNDHEGSSIILVIEIDEPDKVYKMLAS